MCIESKDSTNLVDIGAWPNHAMLLLLLLELLCRRLLLSLLLLLHEPASSRHFLHTLIW